MSIEAFFNTVLPYQGYRCIAKPLIKGYAHHILESNVLAASRAYFLAHKCSDNVYHSCSSLKHFSVEIEVKGHKKKAWRVSENLAFARSFWLDLDCGPDKPYKTQQDILNHLYRFTQDTQLPTPLLVNSGYGIHAYFPLTADLPLVHWRKISQMLHTLVTGYGLQADSSRTCDAASLLRPPGTLNFKDPKNPKLVGLISSAYQTTDALAFAQKLVDAIRHFKFNHTPKALLPTTSHAHLNEALTGGIYDNQSSAPIIADKCAAMSYMRQTQGNIEEPLWHALIGILRYTDEQPDIIHQWSQGHPQYSQAETDDKIAQIEAADLPPTTCQHIAHLNSTQQACAACPHQQQITTPLQLGKKQTEQPALQVLAEPPQSVVVLEAKETPPQDIGMFEVSAKGVYFKDSYAPGNTIDDEKKALVLDYALIIKNSSEDSLLGGIMEIEYHHPGKGVCCFYMEKASLAEKVSFYKLLLKNHITLFGGAVELLRNYMISYLKHLDATQEIQQMRSTMGWQTDDSFVLGRYNLRKKKKAQPIALSVSLQHGCCEGIQPIGKLDDWSNATQILNQPGYEAHALSLLFGFGAPLITFTGYNGVLVNLLGKTNVGKSTMQEFAASIYGNYQDLKSHKTDTYNSLMARLGTLSNLPLVVDEITNIEARDVSDFIYSVSQGREKTRLTAKITDIKPRTWSTMVICSSNSSLSDKLIVSKADPEAEKMRLIEYWVNEPPQFDVLAPQLHDILKANYGTAGLVYLQYILNNKKAVKKLLKGVHQHISANSHALGKERYWLAGISCAITGGFIAAKLNLLHFDMARILKYSIDLIIYMRGEISATQVNYPSVFGRYLNLHTDNVLFLRYGQQQGKKVLIGLQEPKRELLIRVEHDQIGKRVFVDRVHFLGWLQKSSIPSSEFATIMLKSGLLLGVSEQKVIGEQWPQNPSNSTISVMEFYVENTEADTQTANNILHIVR